jgi:phage shock protein C
MIARRTFSLDKPNGKFMGVCAGLANYFNIDVTLLRVGAVVVTLLGAAPWTFVAYFVAAWLGRKKAASAAARGAAAPRTSTYEMRSTLTDIDRRMAEVESYVTSSNSSLAREIEQLR